RTLDARHERVRTTVDHAFGKGHRLELDAGVECLFHEMLAVEQNRAVRSTSARQLAKPRDEWVLTAGDTPHASQLHHGLPSATDTRDTPRTTQTTGESSHGQHRSQG